MLDTERETCRHAIRALRLWLVWLAEHGAAAEPAIAESTTLATDAPAKHDAASDTVKSKPKRVKVNDRMAVELVKNPDSRDWSTQQWAEPPGMQQVNGKRDTAIQGVAVDAGGSAYRTPSEEGKAEEIGRRSVRTKPNYFQKTERPGNFPQRLFSPRKQPFLCAARAVLRRETERTVKRVEARK